MKKLVILILIIAISVGGYLVSQTYFASENKTTSTPTVTVTGDTVTMSKQIVDLLAKEDFTDVENMFYGPMKKAMPVDKLQFIWDAATTTYGPFKRQSIIKEEKLGKFSKVFINCEFEKETSAIEITTAPNKGVMGFGMYPGGVTIPGDTSGNSPTY